jgi:hypothetical protein
MMRATTAPTTRSAAWALVILLLLATRLPSLVEPAGADQSLYAYVGQTIATGGVPYRDAWDQKPPAIHFLYAAMWRVWPHESVVAAGDLVAAGLTACLLILLGQRTFGGAIGYASACLFLLLGNPALQRLSGVRVRGQCETFIALAVTAAFVLALEAGGLEAWRAEGPAQRTRPSQSRSGSWRLVLAGAALGLAFWLKYNAAVFILPVLWLIWRTGQEPDADRRAIARALRRFIWLASGFAAVAAMFLGYFAAHGVLHDLWLATITYNVQYSQETYHGAWSALGYLDFPLERAHVDLLWYLGGIGTIVLTGAFRRHPFTPALIGWMIAACASVAINGARDLPQYFIQAHPALALSAAVGLWPIVQRGRPLALRAVLGVTLVAGLWKVGDEPAAFRMGGQPEVVRNTRFDLSYARGQIDRDTYLSSFKQQQDVKYVPLDAEQLAEHIRSTTTAADLILVFGFASSVYLQSDRRSASRFFWCRPVMVEFGAPRPGYGSAGLLADLQRHVPAVVALQKHWGSGAEDPITFFLGRPSLRRWLEASYVLDQDTSAFTVWRRKT